MLGIDPEFMSHQVAIEPTAKLVVQRKWKLIESKRKIIQEETNKLLAAEFIREIKYTTWLSNVVLVEKKKNGIWRMCVDFTNLNRAYPKDFYLLPNIDKLVDAVVGFKYLSFMDAYLRYNQIRIHPDDKEKIVFMTDGLSYHYKIMPFRLKNAGATY